MFKFKQVFALFMSSMYIFKAMNKIMNMPWLNCFALSAALLLMQGCEHKVNILGQYSSDYHKSLRQHTRSKGSYTIEKIRFETQVVYLSQTLRQAYVDEFASKYRLSSEEKQELLTEQMAENAKNYTFLIFHYATNHKASKIEKKAQNWKVRMQNPDSSVSKPTKIEDLNGEALMLSYFYPQITPWSRNYRVHFPKDSENLNEEITLNLDSVEANLSFNWKN